MVSAHLVFHTSVPGLVASANQDDKSILVSGVNSVVFLYAF